MRYLVSLLALLMLSSSIGQVDKALWKSHKTAKKVAAKKYGGLLDTMPDGLYAVIALDSGDIVCKLEPELAPITTANFVGLAQGNMHYDTVNIVNPYFDSLKFHKVVAGFVIQGGDPKGNGSGGPGYKFVDEFHPELRHDSEGVLSMANSGPSTNGSQFFITLNATEHLNDRHSVFGEVVFGMDVVKNVKQNDVMNSVVILPKGKAYKKYNGSVEFNKALVEREERIAAEKEAKRQAKIAYHDSVKAVLAVEYADVLSTQPDGVYAIINTDKGNVVIQLAAENAPLTTANFAALAQGNMKWQDVNIDAPYFDGISFHRVVADFVVQGGDPTGRGNGSPGYSFPDEFHPSLRHDSEGVLSMANSGPATNGSQFFITLKATPFLDDKHSVFGKVIQGQDVVKMIAQGDKMNAVCIFTKGEQWQDYKPEQIFVSEMMLAKERVTKELLAELAGSGVPYTGEVQFTESGLGYVITEKGDGPQVQKGQKVVIHYTGYLMNGKKFDSSVDRAKPFEVQNIGNAPLIKGWNEGILLFSVGDKGLLIIPSSLGYGPKGAGGTIPPNANLIFEIEVLDAE